MTTENWHTLTENWRKLEAQMYPPADEPEAEITSPVFHDQTADNDGEGWNRTYRH